MKLFYALLATLMLTTLGTVYADISRMNSIFNLVQGSDTWFSAGQPTPDQLAGLPAAGFTRVINIRPQAETPEFDQVGFMGNVDVSYTYLPIAGAQDLSLDNVKKLDALLSEPTEGKTLIHCASGNRVGALMALRAVWLEEKSIDEAISVGEAFGMTRLHAVVRSILGE